MLQQTTVGAVRNRYADFLARFPTLAALARAREETVLAAWSGLGYYSRARNLRRAARRIVREHAGTLPRDPRVLAGLPGFGPYTAAAVASLAFNARVPAAEANILRVVSRLFLVSGRLGTRGHTQAVLERVGDLLPARRPGDALAALMDLGQSLCLPRRPLCGGCPLQARCLASRRGLAEAYPARGPRPRAVSVHLACAVARDGKRALLVRRRETLLDGLWQFPAGEGATAVRARNALRAALNPLGLRLEGGIRAAARHTVVNRRLAITIYEAVPIRGRRRPSLRRLRASRWFGPRALQRAAIPTLTRKIAVAAGLLAIPKHASGESAPGRRAPAVS